MINLTLRHLTRHWRLNLAVLLCLTLTSALLAGFSSYTVAVATHELNQTLDEARPAERGLLIMGSRYTFSEALYELLQEKLAQVLKDRLVIRPNAATFKPKACSIQTPKMMFTVSLLALISAETASPATAAGLDRIAREA